MRDTEYAKELATVEVGEARMERLLIKESGAVEIRFSYWPEGRMAPRPLDLPEEDLLELLVQGREAGVLSDDFYERLARRLHDGR